VRGYTIQKASCRVVKGDDEIEFLFSKQYITYIGVRVTEKVQSEI